ncbi:twin-arginine translocase subunit TatC, partial [Acinetobacter baumannii]
SHVIELRKYLMRILIAVFAAFFSMIPFANDLYDVLSKPLRLQLPAEATMFATDITTTFMAPFKLSFFIAVIVVMPYILYQ